MATFRYDSTVHKLADFTNDPAVIENSLDVIKQFSQTRPTETADLVGEKGGRFFRSIVNVLSFGHQNEVNPRVGGVLNDAIHEAAMALENQPMDHRKIILVVSDGRIVGPNETRFDQNRMLLLQKQIEVYGVSTAFSTFGSFKRSSGTWKPPRNSLPSWDLKTKSIRSTASLHETTHPQRSQHHRPASHRLQSFGFARGKFGQRSEALKRGGGPHQEPARCVS
jgi:hypothetical protein